MAVTAIVAALTVDTSGMYSIVLDVRGARMSLTRREAAKLVKVLTRWIDSTEPE